MKRRCGVRKVVNGRVKFFGNYYYPTDNHKVYNGELEGKKFFFMAYEPRGETKMLVLWGSEKMYWLSDYEKYDQTNEPNVIDGHIYWYFWRQTADYTGQD